MRKLILFLLVFVSAKVSAQVYQEMPQYGYRANRMAFDSTLQIPTVCGVPTLKSIVKTNKSGAIAYDSCNAKFYAYNPKTLIWSEVSGGSGTTPSLQQVLDVNATAYNKNLTLIDTSVGYADRSTIAFNLQRFGSDNYMTINDVYNYRIGKYSNQYARISSLSTAGGNGKSVQIGWENTSDNFMSLSFSSSDFTNAHKIKSGSAFGASYTTTIPPVTGTLAMSVNNQTADENGNITISTGGNDTTKVPFTGATKEVNLGRFNLTVDSLTIGRGNNHSLVQNTALGFDVLKNTTTGNYNTGVGHQSLHNTTTGNYNTAIGQSSLYTNTTGSQNTAIGLNALLYNTTGGSNVALGVDAFQHNTTGGSNTAIGYNAGSHITNGSTPNTTASNSVFIGRDSKAKADGESNQIVIGYNAIGNGSNTVTLGNTSTTANYFTGSINGGSFVKSGGASSQFLKADGSVDASTYLSASDTTVFQRKSIPSYTFLANNTSATANATAQYFKDTSGTYTGTITWGTSAPTGATTHTYRWTRIGNMVTLNISLVYATVSSGNTQVTIALPADAPTPAKPSGTNSASAFLYPATCVGGTTLTASASVATNRGGLRNNSSNNGFEINMAWTSASTFIYFQTSVTYFTN
jgi:hypothetical protein